MTRLSALAPPALWIYCSLSSLALHAQQPPEPPQAMRNQVNFFWGGLFTDDSSPLNSGFNTGFRYGYKFLLTFSAEIETGIVFTDLSEAEGLLGHVQLQARWYPGIGTPVPLFLLGGAGGAMFNTTGVSELSPVLVFGIGADFPFLSGFGFRLDVRDFVLTDMLNLGTTHNLQVIWGVVFHFF